MAQAWQIDAPLSLGSFFPDSDDDNDDTDDNEKVEKKQLDPCYETQDVILASETLQIRQYAYHSHNANRVWPGTFNLADYLLEKEVGNGMYVHHWGSVLELGTATGILAIRMALASSEHVNGTEPNDNDNTNRLDNKNDQDKENTACVSIVTSDVDDEHGDVKDNVHYNFELNEFSNEVGSHRTMPIHVPHTWGSGWKLCASKQGLAERRFDTIVASDILLYISAYAALVETLLELMPLGQSTKFVMSWNRRMKGSAEFFERMGNAGFTCRHEGKCVYTFVLDPLLVRS